MKELCSEVNLEGENVGGRRQVKSFFLSKTYDRGCLHYYFSKARVTARLVTKQAKPTRSAFVSFPGINERDLPCIGGSVRDVSLLCTSSDSKPSIVLPWHDNPIRRESA